MKIKNGFMLREVAGSYIVVAVGKASAQFNGLITLNETGVVIWKALEKGADENELVAAVTAEYDIDRETAARDVSLFVEKCKKVGILE